jgi:hypothetical protein
MLQAEISIYIVVYIYIFFKEKPCGKWEIDILGCLGMILYEGYMEGVWMENANLLSAIPVSGRLFTRRSNFLNFHKTIDHWLCTHWTAAFTARPPRMGSTTCNTIFQVSNRAIRCILERSGSGLEAAGRILYEFAYHQLRDSGNTGMYSYFPMKFMQRVAWFALIRQIFWRTTCSVSDRHIFHKYFGRNGVNRRQNLGIYGNPSQNRQSHSKSTRNKNIGNLLS